MADTTKWRNPENPNQPAFGRGESPAEKAKRVAVEQYHKKPIRTIAVASVLATTAFSAVAIPTALGIGMGLGLIKDMYSPETVDDWKNWKQVERQEELDQIAHDEKLVKMAEAKKMAQAAKEKAEEAVKLAELEKQKEAAKGLMTPEIEAKIFERVDIRKAVCAPHGYSFEARLNADNVITYFKEKPVMTARTYGGNWGGSYNKCSSTITLENYPNYINLGTLVTKNHFGLLADIFVQCGTGVETTSFPRKNKEGGLTYNFSIESKISGFRYDKYGHSSDYNAYQKCVNESHTLPQFQIKQDADKNDKQAASIPKLVAPTR